MPGARLREVLPPGSNRTGPPQLVKATAGLFEVSPRFTFYILLCKGGPLEISPEVSSPLRQHSTLLLNLVFILNTERKTPAFSLSENQPPRLPLQPRVFSYCTIMNHASVRNIISSPGEEQNVWNRICIKHALTGRKGGCLVGENYRVSV